MQLINHGNQFDVGTAFTSLALLNIIINPIAELVMTPTHLNTALTCFDRIQEFIVKQKRDEFRTLPEGAQTAGLYSDHVADAGDQLEPGTPLIQVSGGSFGWTSDKTVVSNATFDVNPGSLTIVIGPVGSGKSTLLKALVGETYLNAGAVSLNFSGAVAFCDQDPWILNRSIRDNVVGESQFRPEIYESVIRACQLGDDIRAMPRGDQTAVGSQGSTLSGGQKHRIVSD